MRMGERPSISVSGGALVTLRRKRGTAQDHGKKPHHVHLTHPAAPFQRQNGACTFSGLGKGDYALTLSRMIHFTLFGIPIYIRPTFWIVLAIFGGILGVSSVESLIYPALFVIAGFIAILSHELGHALVGRKLGGGQQTIILELFGGVTSSHGMQLTRAGRVLMILAGPMMTLVLGVISILVAWNIVGPVLTANGKDFWDLVLYPYLATAVSPKLYILSCLIMIGEWWTVLNLLPIYPLDGGQLVAQFVRSPKKVFMTGFITSIAIGLVSFQLFHGYFIPIFMALFAFSNYREYKNAPF